VGILSNLPLVRFGAHGVLTFKRIANFHGTVLDSVGMTIATAANITTTTVTTKAIAIVVNVAMTKVTSCKSNISRQDGLIIGVRGGWKFTLPVLQLVRK